MKKHMKCRHCRAKATPCNYYGSEMKEPYLYRCTKKDCGTFFWHRNVLQEFNLKDDPKSDQNKRIEENLVKKFKIPKSSYPRAAYVIKLSRKSGETKDSVYIGETGHHPLRRYLQHIRGYNSGKGHAKKRAKYLLSYETEIKDSKKREKELGEELQDKYIITGAH